MVNDDKNPNATERATGAQSAGHLALFTYPMTGARVRAIWREGETLIHLGDICKALGHSKPSVAAQMLDDDEKVKLDMRDLSAGGSAVVFPTPATGNTTAWFVTEAGFYTVALRSDAEGAKPFRRWVAHDVLPSIRKNGVYDITAPEAQTAELAELRRAFTVIQADNAALLTENEQLSKRCDRYGPRAIGAFGAETYYGGQPLWDLRAQLARSLDVGLRQVMGRLVELGVLVRHSSNAYRIQRGWEDVLFCETSAKAAQGGLTVHSTSAFGTPKVWPGMQDAFFERIAERRAERERRVRDAV